MRAVIYVDDGNLTTNKGTVKKQCYRKTILEINTFIFFHFTLQKTMMISIVV